MIGVHDLGPGSKSPITGARPDFCAYCHAPHSGLEYRPVEPETDHADLHHVHQHNGKEHGHAAHARLASNQCLSCHDGTVAVGDHGGLWPGHHCGVDVPADVFGSNMQTSHPFSLALPLKDNIDLAASLVREARPQTPPEP